MSFRIIYCAFDVSRRITTVLKNFLHVKNNSSFLEIEIGDGSHQIKYSRHIKGHLYNPHFKFYFLKWNTCLQTTFKEVVITYIHFFPGWTESDCSDSSIKWKKVPGFFFFVTYLAYSKFYFFPLKLYLFFSTRKKQQNQTKICKKFYFEGLNTNE